MGAVLHFESLFDADPPKRTERLAVDTESQPGKLDWFTFTGSRSPIKGTFAPTPASPLGGIFRSEPFPCMGAMFGRGPAVTAPPRQPASFESTEEKFRRLADAWRRDVMHVSDTTERLAHPAHLRIIGMGAAVVPVLLRELQRQPGHWVNALHFITEADPVPSEARGDIRAMTAAWLQWGKERGYL